jgi:hypothetical protein
LLKNVKSRKRLSGNSGSLSQAASVPDFPIQVESLRFEVKALLTYLFILSFACYCDCTLSTFLRLKHSETYAVGRGGGIATAMSAIP